MRYAFIQNEKVTNIIMWDGRSNLGLDGELIEISDTSRVGIGFSYIDGKFIAPEQPPAPPQTSEQARRSGENYVQTFFTLMQLQRLTLVLAGGNDNQKKLTQEVLDWLDNIEMAWLTNPVSFVADKFGVPPHEYIEILTAK